MGYIQIPQAVAYKDILNKKSLSPNDYKTILLTNKNLKSVKDLITSTPKKGKEVGSFSYISKSKFYFMRTKALQPSNFLPILNDVECVIPILPSVFKDSKLQKGDTLLLKDGNIGEVVFVNDDIQNFMLSAGIVKLQFQEDLRYYIFALMKNKFFKDQINLRGTTIKHSKSIWLDALIPFPNKRNKAEIISFVSLLTQSIINKETEIKSKFRQIINLIRTEIINNQKAGNSFSYSNPNIKEAKTANRLDAGLFCEEYQREQFLIRNYQNGTKNITASGFDFKRGQNLQVSTIGKSVYVEDYKPNLYRLIRPVDISDYGTIEKYEYLGNKEQLLTLNKNDIVFSAEGTIGKVCIFVEVGEKTITNIHGLTFFKIQGQDDVESIFFGLFLRYLKEVGILDYISVGGQGGSLSGKWEDHILIPDFPRKKREEISQKYYDKVQYDNAKLTLAGFKEEDDRITQSAGIWQLDWQVKTMKEKLDQVINDIAEDRDISVDFSFLLG